MVGATAKSEELLKLLTSDDAKELGSGDIDAVSSVIGDIQDSKIGEDVNRVLTQNVVSAVSNLLDHVDLMYNSIADTSRISDRYVSF